MGRRRSERRRNGRVSRPRPPPRRGGADRKKAREPSRLASLTSWNLQSQTAADGNPKRFHRVRKCSNRQPPELTDRRLCPARTRCERRSPLSRLHPWQNPSARVLGRHLLTGPDRCEASAEASPACTSGRPSFECLSNRRCGCRPNAAERRARDGRRTGPSHGALGRPDPARPAASASNMAFPAFRARAGCQRPAGRSAATLSNQPTAARTDPAPGKGRVRLVRLARPLATNLPPKGQVPLMNGPHFGAGSPQEHHAVSWAPGVRSLLVSSRAEARENCRADVPPPAEPGHRRSGLD